MSTDFGLFCCKCGESEDVRGGNVREFLTTHYWNCDNTDFKCEQDEFSQNMSLRLKIKSQPIGVDILDSIFKRVSQEVSEKVNEELSKVKSIMDALSQKVHDLDIKLTKTYAIIKFKE